MNDDIRQFAADFPKVTEGKWRENVEKFIKGADFDETLVSRSEDGIAKGPLFTKLDTTSATPIFKSNAPHLDDRTWHVSSFIQYPDVKIDILEDLKGGASALLIEDDIIRSKSDVERLLTGIFCDLVPIYISPSQSGLKTSAILAAHFQSNPKLADIYVSLGHAPEENQDDIAGLASWVLENAPHWKALSVNARAAHEAGGSPAQELAYMLHQGTSYIKTLLAAGITLKDALALIDIYLASDQDGHQGIIKLRAARQLWACMTENFDAAVKDRNCHIHAVSSERMMAKQDPWSNMIRLSASSFGAVCGGANAITVLPFTHSLGLPTSFGRRISRNMQLMMMEESRLGHVHDPAHGSFMHEKLTVELAEKAWSLFQNMQTQAAPLTWLAEQVEITRQERQSKIDENELLLVGVNQYSKPDIRKARIRRSPESKPRKGRVIGAETFEGAILQAQEGYLAPITTAQSLFPKTRLSEKFDNAGGV